jgi:hypothetical protein
MRPVDFKDEFYDRDPLSSNNDLCGVVLCVCKMPEPKLKVSENGIHAYCNNCAKTYLQK